MYLFGTSSSILFDINLIIQYIVLVILVVGVYKRGLRREHGRLMVAATSLNLITVFLIMAPALFLNLSLYNSTIFVHAALGMTVLLVSFVFIGRFGRAISTQSPLVCGSKNIMRLAIILWLLPLFGGTFVYLQLYVLV